MCVQMANVSKEMLLVLMVAAVAVVGLVLLATSGEYKSEDITGQVYKIGTTPKKLSSITLKKPDFYVKWVTLEQVIYNPEGGSKIIFGVEIQNKGQAAGIVNDFTVNVYAYNTETVPVWDKGDTFTDTTEIAAGSSVMLEEEIEVSDEWAEEILNGYDQDIDVLIYADWGDKTRESDETNNERSSTAHVALVTLIRS